MTVSYDDMYLDDDVIVSGDATSEDDEATTVREEMCSSNTKHLAQYVAEYVYAHFNSLTSPHSLTAPLSLRHTG